MALRTVLTKSLKVAESVDIQVSNDTITVELTKSVFERICRETDNQPLTHRQVGCLLSSAIACALVKVVRQPVTIQRENLNLEKRITQIQYVYGNTKVSM